MFASLVAVVTVLATARRVYALATNLGSAIPAMCNAAQVIAPGVACALPGSACAIQSTLARIANMSGVLGIAQGMASALTASVNAQATSAARTA
jgi:hypothetical protein